MAYQGPGFGGNQGAFNPYGQGPTGGQNMQQGYQQPQYNQPGGYNAYNQGQQGSTGYYGGAPGMAGGTYPGSQNSELWNWFVAVDVDRTGQITANELQSALTNSNWSHFNAETCRLMIGMFDRDKTGTINYEEFTHLWKYIQDWRNLFTRYDTDRSGVIDGSELHRAFSDMGYRLSPSFVKLILIRFDTFSKSTLKLDTFIQCCVMLKSLTDSFRIRDTNMNGQIQVNYEDFMCMCLADSV